MTVPQFSFCLLIVQTQTKLKGSDMFRLRKNTVATLAFALIALAVCAVVSMQDWLFDSHYRNLYSSISKLELVYKRPDVAAANKVLKTELDRVHRLRLTLIDRGTFSEEEQSRYCDAVIELERAYNAVVKLASPEIREYKFKTIEFLKHSDSSGKIETLQYLHKPIAQATELQLQSLRLITPGSNAVEKAKERAGQFGITLKSEDLKRSYSDGLLAELKSSVFF